jgi:hypothetical protein
MGIEGGLGIPGSALPWPKEIKSQGAVRDIWDRLGFGCGKVLSYGAKIPNEL